MKKIQKHYGELNFAFEKIKRMWYTIYLSQSDWQFADPLNYEDFLKLYGRYTYTGLKKRFIKDA